MRLTNKQIEKIKKLKELKQTPKDISIKLKIPYSTVLYHYSEEYKFKTKQKAIKNNKKYKKDKIKNKEYQKKYHKKKYETDPIYREYIQTKNRENQRKRYRLKCQKIKY